MSDNKPVKTSGRKAVKYRGAKCLNCSHPLDLSDVHCSYCGQLNTTKQLSLKDFFGEFIGSVITYDSRLRYTLKDLLFKPGTITRNYVEGQRLKYANPFRFFLSVSIIYFLIQGLIATFNDGSNSFINWNDGNNNTVEIDSLKNQNLIITNEQGGVDTIPIFNDEQVKAFDSLKGTIGKEKDEPEKDYKYSTEAELDTIQWSNRIIERFVLYHKFYKNTEIKDPIKALDSLKHKNSSFNRWVYDKNSALDRIKEKPFEFVNYLMGKIPFFLFFFAPIYALFFWILYSRKKYTYMEHMVFIFHIFSFVFLALLMAILPDLLLKTNIFTGVLIGIIGPFYFYKALRNFYKQSRLITIIKFVILNVFFWIGANVAALIFFAITAAIY